MVRFGAAAVLVEVPDLAAVRRADDALRAARAGGGWDDVEDQVPAAETILVRVRPGTDLRALGRRIRSVLTRADEQADEQADDQAVDRAADRAADRSDEWPAHRPGASRARRDASGDAPPRVERERLLVVEPRLVVLPVTYDGPDLHDVADATGLSVEDVVARHLAPTYTVAFGGFMPGFAYLVGLDPALVVPRRTSPRERVPAGSVAVADRFTAVYPAATPGGWRLLGTSRTTLFDVARAEPALLTPGTRVRFEAAR
ncbi:carboxyltransferase domain-containing protein [Cellulomonas sp. DKR-3]|uniref:Carboxyltransferase domain-containing protein n=1 Tax=Cellulomonas fulva TaxID=2835530 RepID=A0ABS5TYD3_9CELL|nr:carboxyltransferase domain-containing protein [Cellulomonas fulva]